MAKILFLVITLMSTFSFAGGVVVGDGGYVLKCGAARAVVLDLKEYEFISGEKYQVPQISLMAPRSSPSDFNEYLQFFINRAVRVLGYAHPFIKTLRHADEVYENVDFRSSWQFRISNKLGPIYTEVPQGCSLQQVGVRYIQDGVERVMLEQDVTWGMDWYNFSVLIVHESLHSWFDPQETSLPVRQAIWYLAGSDEFRTKNAETFVRLINEKQPQVFER